MTTAALALRQVKYENKAFWRNPAAALFTFAFPLMFLVIFNGLEIGPSEFFVPSIAAFAVMTACYTNIAITLSFARDEGVLKRVRGTPLPSWAYLFGRITHAVFLAVLLLAIVTAAGALFYDVQPPWEHLDRLAAAVAVGAASFCALGFAVTILIPNAEAAPPIVNFSILPLLFISDVFYPSNRLPEWLQTLAGLFPVKHFAESVLASFDATLKQWELADLAIVAAWGLAAVVIAARRFSWEPRR